MKTSHFSFRQNFTTLVMDISALHNITTEKNITYGSNSVTQGCFRLHFDNLPKTPAVMASIIGTSILNVPSSVFAVFSNAIVMYTIWNKPSLRTPANFLIFSMCFSDFLVGLTVQPLSLALMWLKLSGIHPCSLKMCLDFFAFICCAVSLLNTALVTMDRYWAICMPYRYHPEVLKRKYTFAITAVWLILVPYTLLHSLKVISGRAFTASLACIVFLVLVFNLSCYCKIYLVIRQHKRQISSQLIQVQPSLPESHDQVPSQSPTEKKRLNVVIILVLVLLACYLPYMLFPVFYNTLQLSTEVSYVFFTWVRMPVFWNSAFNPIVYCLKMPAIAEEVRKVLKRLKARILCRND